MANGMSKKMEEYLARQRALGYEPSLDGVDEEDFDYVPSWSSQNPDRQLAPELGREYRPVDRGLAERIYKMFARPFDPNWQMPDLDGPEYSQPQQPGLRLNGMRQTPYGTEENSSSDLLYRGPYDPNGGPPMMTKEYRNYRSPERNASIPGASPTSWHTKGLAVDIDLSEYTSEEIAKIEQMARERFGEVLYHDAGDGGLHLHIGNPLEP